MNALVTDYSSASSDAVYKNVITIEYCPDFDWYRSKDRGFNDSYENCHIGNLVIDPSCLFDVIRVNLQKGLDYEKNAQIKKYLFSSSCDTYDSLLLEMFKKIKV